jgi:uncharacterized protein (TIGR02266 family)
MTSEPADGERKPVEKRAHPRTPIPALQVRGESKRRFFFGYVRNLSLEGLFIQTTNPRPPGTSVRLEFSLQRESPPVECAAEVVWVQPFSVRSKAPPGMGLRFTELDERAAVRVEAFLKAQDRDRP